MTYPLDSVYRLYYMKSILETCTPRKDITEGSFNPEVFTASLSQVIDHYSGGASGLDNVYTNPETFFKEGTFPTSGMKTVLQEVFGRIAGDNKYPAIHRLETAFGGGKTHTLIACTHIAHCGNKLAGVANGMIDASLLPEPDTVAVVGVPGDSLPVQKAKGKALTPYTLWGEIAFQVGGKALYNEVSNDAESFAAPGKDFFSTVFGGRKALVMLDELAQYAARLEAAHPGGGAQLGAFLMALHGYARNNGGIAIVFTLASKSDAFSQQTDRLKTLLSDVQGQEISENEALDIATRAEKDTRSVVARDSVSHTPVEASEISRVLAKRLFDQIDESAADVVAAEYKALYQKSSSLLPEEANHEGYDKLIAANYPFHPTFITYLSDKLTLVENFQGTRGVLRVLALAVRNLWRKKTAIPMVHTCHLDLRDARIVNEVIARTNSGELLTVLNADIGGVDTDQLEGKTSNAQIADRANPHPEGFPMVEWTWKAIFLHSLVGRDEGLNSNVFGLTESDALFEVAMPGLTPPQVQTALSEISEHASYLRARDGRYFASLDPTVNLVLSRIRKLLSSEERSELLNTTTRKLVKADAHTFKILTDITDPGQIPDGGDLPQLALIALDAKEVEPEDFITTKGSGTARVQQNLVFLLIPDTVIISSSRDNALPSMSEADRRAERSRERIESLANWVLAMRKLNKNPKKYGVSAAKLAESDFESNFAEREQALITAVAETYSSLWFPSASGTIARKEIKTTGAEGGQDLMNSIRELLVSENELVLPDHTARAYLINYNKLFFEQADTITVEQLRKNFREKRQWPILDHPSVLDRILVEGARQGEWCLYRMGEADQTHPENLYTRDVQEVPLGLDLSGKEWSIVHIPGAKKRGWMDVSTKVDPSKVYKAAQEEASVVSDSPRTVREFKEAISARIGDVEDDAMSEAIHDALQRGHLVAYQGKAEQTEKPSNLVFGADATFHKLEEDEVLTTKATAAKRGWITPESRSLHLGGQEARDKLIPLLGKLGALYHKGGKSTLSLLQLDGLELPGGGTLRLDLVEATPDSLKQLDEFFEVLADQVQAVPETIVDLEIRDPDDDCSLIQSLRSGE